jgi:hypothetical protein
MINRLTNASFNNFDINKSKQFGILFFFSILSRRTLLTRELPQVPLPISMRFCLEILQGILVKTLKGFGFLLRLRCGFPSETSPIDRPPVD